MHLKKRGTCPSFLPGDTQSSPRKSRSSETSLEGEEQAGVKTQGQDGECATGWDLFHLKAFSNISGNIVQALRDLSVD